MKLFISPQADIILLNRPNRCVCGQVGPELFSKCIAAREEINFCDKRNKQMKIFTSPPRGIRRLLLQKSDNNHWFFGDRLMFGDRLTMRFGRRRALRNEAMGAGGTLASIIKIGASFTYV